MTHFVKTVHPSLFNSFFFACTQLYKSLCWSVGRSVRWSVGPSVRWSVGPSVRPSIHRSVGLLVRWSVGPSVRRPVGRLLTSYQRSDLLPCLCAALFHTYLSVCLSFRWGFCRRFVIVSVLTVPRVYLRCAESLFTRAVCRWLKKED